ncbi:C-X-C motif chemokine 9 [Hoplias malabaricus]|uniref:C-X-C motif chemokine 9 n=1 Tax=Hoplias malabaricus TaxID=27720 RepID=UPI0034633ACE
MSTLHTLTALLAVGLCIIFTAKFGDSQHVPVRCECHNSKVRVQGPVSDYKVLLRRPGCPRNEIIVTMKNNKKICLSPDKKQGKHLLRCWYKTDKGNVKKCLRRLSPKSQKKQKKPKRKQ